MRKGLQPELQNITNGMATLADVDFKSTDSITEQVKLKPLSC